MKSNGVFGKIFGLVLLLGAAGSIIWYTTLSNKVAEVKKLQGENVTINALVGGEKMAFLKNPRIVSILSDKYSITVTATKMGSMEMVTMPTTSKDCLWPSNQVAADMFRDRGGVWQSKDNIFNSPIVFYAWDQVADAFVRSGIASQSGTSYYLDFSKLASLIVADKTWADAGLPQLNGKIKVFTTDPNKSNSGNMFAGLLADTLNHGDAPDLTALEPILPKIQHYFGRMGSMEISSSDLFDKFLGQGVGAFPMIVGYENQLVEFALVHPEAQTVLRTKIRTVYPQPTIWGEHPLIVLTANGKRLSEALHDPDILKIAWEQHGFRSGMSGVQNDPKILQVTGIPEQITAVTPMPSAAVMQKIIESLVH